MLIQPDEGTQDRNKTKQNNIAVSKIRLLIQEKKSFWPRKKKKKKSKLSRTKNKSHPSKEKKTFLKSVKDPHALTSRQVSR